jgi:chromosome segregation ATPase
MEQAKKLENLKQQLDGRLNAANDLVSSTKHELSLLNNRAKKLEDLKQQLDGRLNAANALVSSIKHELSLSNNRAKKLEDSKQQLEGRLNAANDSLKGKTNEFKEQLFSAEEKLSSLDIRAKELVVSKGELKQLNEELEKELNDSLEKTRTKLSSKIYSLEQEYRENQLVKTNSWLY